MILFRYLAKKIYFYFISIFIVFFGLFVLLDFISESKVINSSYSTWIALSQVALRTPYYLYEFTPIATLIASILAINQFSQHSESVVMRMHGLSPMRLIRYIALIALPLICLTFLLGEYLVPISTQLSTQIKQKFLKKTYSNLNSGIWLKYQDEQKENKYYIRVINPNLYTNAAATPAMIKQLQFKQVTQLKEVYIYHFRMPKFKITDGVDTHITAITNSINTSTKNNTFEQLANVYYAESIDIDYVNKQFILHQVKQLQVQASSAYNNMSSKAFSNLSEVRLNIYLPNALLNNISFKDKASSMSLKELAVYSAYLKNNQQDTQAYDLMYFKKMMYPLMNVFMLWIASCFIYVHHRKQAIAQKIFMAVFLGLAVYLSYAIFLQVANFKNWSPLYSATLPFVLYTACLGVVFKRISSR